MLKVMQSTQADRALEALKDVVDPELGVDIVNLGLVYNLSILEDGSALIEMTLTSVTCPLTDMIEDQVASVLSGVTEGYQIEWVWSPPWGSQFISDDGREMLRALGYNL